MEEGRKFTEKSRSHTPTDVTHEILRSCVSTVDNGIFRSCRKIDAIWKGHLNTILRNAVCTQLISTNTNFRLCIYSAILFPKLLPAQTDRITNGFQLATTVLNASPWTSSKASRVLAPPPPIPPDVHMATRDVDNQTATSEQNRESFPFPPDAE